MAEETDQEWAARLTKQAQTMYDAYDRMGVYDREPMSRTAATEHVSAPVNPWAQNAFDPFHGPGGAHRPRRRPGQIPDSRLLFDVQKDMLKAINLLKEGNTDAALTQCENAYKLMRRYLVQYVPVHQDDTSQDIVR